MSRARRIWKWTAAAFAAVLVVLAVAVGAFRVWLEQSPQLGPDIVAKIEKRSGLDLEFTSIDARLGPYGPELAFENAVIRVPGERDALATAKAGRVGFDWWRFVRTGRLASGRVTLDGARLHVYVTADGLELRGQGALFRDRDPNAPLRLDRLPMGHVAVTNATLTVQDLRTRGAPLQLHDVELDAERSRGALVVQGHAELPRALGERLELEARLEGDLVALDRTAWAGTAAIRDAQLAGLTAFLPQWSTRAADGHGDVRVEARGVGVRLDAARARLALADVKARPAPARAVAPPVAAAAADPLAPPAATQGAPAVVLAPVAFRRLVADARLERLADGWRIVARDVDLDPGRDAAWRDGELEFELRRSAARVERLALRSPSIRLDALAPLATFAPPGELRDALAALSPEGALTLVDLALTRGAAPREWRVDGSARFTGLGVGAWRGVPGIGGLDGDVSANGAAGRVRVRSSGLRFDLPRYLEGEVGANDVRATFEWWWRPDGWRFAADDVHVVAPAGRGGGKARLWIPTSGDSPRLVLDLAIADVDAPRVVSYLPLRRFSARTSQWLRDGVLAGRVPRATLEYAGEMRRFPFRDGGGLFRVRADFDGLRLHYQDGWADLEGARGEVEFRNQGFVAKAGTARVGGLAVEAAEARMDDYRDARLLVEAQTRGDARQALAYVQSSPVGPRLGEFFMGVKGAGPFAADVRLDFPFRRFADRVVEVRASFDGATARLPAIDDELRGLVGSFVLVNRDVDVPLVTGTFLGGPFRLKASTVDGARGERVIVAEASGRALAPRLQPQFRITSGAWLQGAFDWRAQGRIPRLEWRPDPEPVPADAPPGTEPVPSETQVRWVPATIRADTNFVGTTLAFPAPFAKGADEPRALRADVTWDWGLEAGAPAPPKQLRARDTVRPAGVLVRAQLGRDSAALEWRREPAWSFRRGTLRFGGGAPALRDARGLWLEGALAEFDLSAWLRVRLTATNPAPVVIVRGAGVATPAAPPARAAGLGAYLRGGTVSVGRFAFLGYAFPDVALTLEGRDDAWRAQVDGPAAKGAIVVPWQLPDGPPLVLDMDRLVLDARTPAPAVAAADEPPLPPAQLPALQIDVRTLEIYKRRFGSLQASVVRVPQGLKLERGRLTGGSFEASGTGDWLAGPRGEETRVSVETTSTDVLDTLSAWGFAPTLTGTKGTATADLRWSGGPDGDVFARLNGKAKIAIQDGQLVNVAPGAGRVLGLMSVGALPRRLTLDFTDLTDKGFAFDRITGDFEFRDGNAYTKNLLLKGPAAEIGIAGRTGLGARDYEQTAMVTGHFGGPIAAAGALAGGPAVGAALLLFSKVFDGPLSGMARGYYRITGNWDQPKVERIDAAAAREAGSGQVAKDAEGDPPG